MFSVLLRKELAETRVQLAIFLAVRAQVNSNQSIGELELLLAWAHTAEKMASCAQISANSFLNCKQTTKL